MDTKWTKTHLECDCNWLQRSADDPEVPVRFDAGMSEFHFAYPGPSGGEGRLLIRHCPFCGGKAPASKRPSFFHIVSRQERARPWQLTEALATEADVRAALGEPDHEHATGSESETPERDGSTGVIERFRSLEYTRLSDTANLTVLVSPDDRVRFLISGKPREPASIRAC